MILNTLGTALYRAGRPEEAIRVLREGISLRGGKELPQDWAILAMAHHRLGRPAEARIYLDRLAVARPGTPGVDPFWEGVEIDVLRREARALIGRTGRELPADIFAPW